MEPKIYTSSFRTGPDATKKQQMLFATDTDYALSEGYQFIKDSNGDLFQIIDERNLLQVSEEEALNYPESLEQDPMEAEFSHDCCDCSSEAINEHVCLNCDNIDTIDSIIFNTLNQAEPLRPTQVDSLLKMAQLKQLLRATK